MHNCGAVLLVVFIGWMVLIVEPYTIISKHSFHLPQTITDIVPFVLPLTDTISYLTREKTLASVLTLDQQQGWLNHRSGHSLELY